MGARDVIIQFFSGVGIGVAFTPQEIELEMVEFDSQLESTPLLELALLLELVPLLELIPFGYLVIKISSLVCPVALCMFTHTKEQQRLLLTQLLTYSR